MLMTVIYLVEDDDNIRKLVCYSLSREGYEIKGFALPSEFRNEYLGAKPNLVMLDIMLPEEDGLSILEKIRKDDADIPIIMLTAKDSEFDKVTGLDMGADDYIAKPFGMTELVSRVRAVLRRSMKNVQSEEKAYHIGELYVCPERHIVKVSDKEIMLSYKEYSLLLALLEAEGKVVKREELLCRVWGEYYGESRTLDVHIRTLRTKLESAGKYILTVKGIGHKIDCEGNNE
jgi:two-component system alkaline phosphatase synthesis response regulator PhoP